MPKKSNVYNYILAFNILKGIESINTIECENEDTNEIILKSNRLDPEKLFLKKESFDKLSPEAKHLIITVINAPEEFINLFRTPKRILLSKRMFRKCLIESWKSEYLVDAILKEIKEWVQINLQ